MVEMGEDYWVRLGLFNLKEEPMGYPAEIKEPPMTTTPAKYRSGNVHVEAMHFTEQTGPAVWEWADSKPLKDLDGNVYGLRIYTPTGDARAAFGDWVVRYAEGFYPVKADVFADRFQPVS